MMSRFRSAFDKAQRAVKAEVYGLSWTVDEADGDDGSDPGAQADLAMTQFRQGLGRHPQENYERLRGQR